MQHQDKSKNEAKSFAFDNIDGPLVFAGECMLELVRQNGTNKHNTLGKSFAGDLYNSSVYLKRAFPQFHVEFMSCIGNDMLSEEFLQSLHSENLGSDYLPKSDSHHLGAYMVVTDEQGERSFIYWRNDSAAKRMISALNQSQHSTLLTAGIFFFSGISIAILLDEERSLFWRLLEQMKRAGVKIAFDPNYRPQLWRSAETAKANIEKACHMADILLPGIDDFDKLYGMKDLDECLAFCEQFNAEELVMKQGEKTVHVINADGKQSIPVVPNDNVVDTTSAGDAFNGVYIGSRCAGHSVKSSVRAASATASKVIETPGAIMPAALFNEFWEQYEISE
ncbi:sugar kinase [Glaciecola sp. MH2013]|uniref:sugar kinase n=1 Tax=Glaciecola sp. MH2013 TaxID=2785524 RepID=UPI00189DDFB0|nr:sugar kinase [Glaciecola sp. MH2013]MBF7073613.1 sugar kinase [Glaciecola sp. MH2013]